MRNQFTRQSRARAMVIPREHGAWGMLLIPLATGAAVGLSAGQHLASLGLFSIIALALFWLRTPLESSVGAGPMRATTPAEINAVFFVIAGLGSIVMISAVALLWSGRNRGLLLVGVIAAAAFAAQALLKRAGRRFRMASQIVGALGLASAAPGAYYVVCGRLDERGLALWLANWIFAGDQIHFVQLRIHAARVADGREKILRGRGFLVGQAIMASALIAAWRWGHLPAIAVLAFVPVLIRGFLWFLPGPRPLAVKRLGWTELAHALAFGVLLTVGFLLQTP